MTKDHVTYEYSQSLIEETVKCFFEENNLIISNKTAIEYLDSMSGLFLSFADRKTSALTQRGAEVFSGCVEKECESNRVHDLIITHNCKNKKT